MAEINLTPVVTRKTKGTSNQALLKEIKLLREENAQLRSQQQSTPVVPIESVGVNDSCSSMRPRGFRMTIVEAKTLIPEFTPGKTLMTAAQWIETIEKSMVVYGWEGLEAMFYATAQLQAAAKQWYESQHGQIKSWEEFKENFIIGFPTVDDGHKILMQLMKRERQNGEEIETYFYSMVALAEKANISQSETMRYIISGLNDSKLITILDALKPKTLPELLTEIKIREGTELYRETRRNFQQNTKHEERTISNKYFKNNTTEQRSYQSNYLNTRRPFGQNYSKFIQGNNKRSYDHNSRNSNFQQSRNNQPSTSEQRKCYICRQVGHLAFQCKNRRSNMYTANAEPPQKRSMRQVAVSNNENECYQKVIIGDIELNGFLDLGSDCTTIKLSVAQENEWKYVPYHMTLHGFGGGKCNILGKINKIIKIGEVELETEIIVVDDDAQDIPIIVGRTFLNHPNVMVIKKWGVMEVCKNIVMSNVKIDRKKATNEVLHRQMIINKRNIDLMDLQIGEVATDQEKEQLVALLNSYREAVALDILELGLSKDDVMEIKLKSKEIVRYKPYRVPYNQIPILEEIIKELLENDIIENSSSEYSSPVLLVRKKDGKFRMCVDYRKLNSITERENFPTPNIEEQIQSLYGMKVFTVLDLMSGYYQVSIDKASRHFTAFVVPFGQYQFKRMPFGLTNAPAVFMRMMARIAAKLTNQRTKIYVDDCLIPAENVGGNLINLEDFLKVLQEAGLTINIKKCDFFSSRITYLGHEISVEGIMPGFKNISAIRDYAVPTTVTEVRRFLGLTGFFRKFIFAYSITARPLHKLTGKDVNFVWGELEQKAFDELKTKLCNEPILTIYNPSAKHELHTDASSEGLAGILLQIADSNLKQAVAYFSRATSKVEEKYHSYELEALAVVESLERFKYYLLNKKFTIYTDCNSLKMTHKKKDLVPKIARWWLRIQEFDFDLEFRSGKLMSHVDALSRAPVEDYTESDIVGYRQIMAIGMDNEDWVSTLQLQDSELKEIFNVLQGISMTKRVNANDIKKEYEIKQGRIYKKTEDGLKFVLPKGARWRIIRSLHDDVGHFGLDKTVNLIKRTYWFAKMHTIVKKYINSCIDCLYNKRGADESRFTLHPIQKIAVPFHTVHVDHVGPFPKSRRQNVHVVAIIDAFTKYVILRPVRSTNTNGVVKTFDEISQFFGIPVRIISDRGTAFTSNKFMTYVKENSILHIKTAVRTPRANGQIERYFRTFNSAVACMSKESSGKDWDDYLPAIQWGLNNIRHEITGKTAQQLLFAYEPPNNVHNKLSMALQGDLSGEDIEVDLLKLRSVVEERMGQNQKKLAESFNSKHKGPKTYKEGDIVLLRAEHPATGTSRKLLTRYRGPYKIEKVLGNDRYEIVDTDTTQVTQKPFRSVFSADKMKPWCNFTDLVFNDISEDEETETV